MLKLIKLALTIIIIVWLISLITSCSNYQSYYIALGDSVAKVKI